MTEKTQNAEQKIVKEVKVKVYHKQTKEGKKFDTYRAVKKDGTLVDCKFRKEIVAPTQDSVVVAYAEDMNMSYAKEYPTLWFKDIIEIKPIERTNTKIDDLF